MRKSKFVGKTFDNNWKCTGCNLAANYGHGTKHNKYWYAFQRETSDGKFDKWIRVESSNATLIWKGELSVEDLCKQRETRQDTKHGHSVNYNFK